MSLHVLCFDFYNDNRQLTLQSVPSIIISVSYTVQCSFFHQYKATKQNSRSTSYLCGVHICYHSSAGFNHKADTMARIGYFHVSFWFCTNTIRGINWPLNCWLGQSSWSPAEATTKNPKNSVYIPLCPLEDYKLLWWKRSNDTHYRQCSLSSSSVL